jgi:hypothetical protein
VTAKLHINMSQGLIDLEGDPDLVREIYADFRTHLLDSMKTARSGNPAPANETDPEPKSSPAAPSSSKQPQAKRRTASKKKTVGEDGGNGISANSPKLDKQLDTSGLEDFYGVYDPKNSPERILIFLKFLSDEKGIDQPNTDQVFTCYKAVGAIIPKAFGQAFHDTSTKFGYIDFKSPTDLPVTIAGDNHFTHKLKKKTAE